MLLRTARTALKWRRTIILVVAALVGLAMFPLGITRPADRALVEARSALFPKKVGDQLLLVELDRRSIEAVRSWPWPRRVHGALIDRLVAAGARKVALDMDFSAPSNPVDDSAMAAAIARADGRVVLGTLAQPSSRGSSTIIESLPIPELRKNAALGLILTRVDSDGKFRSQVSSMAVGGERHRSIAAVLSGADTGSGNKILFDQSIDPGSVRRLSAIDIVEGRFDPALVRGRDVLIGGTALEIGDRATLPIWGRLPGVYVHVIAYETLRRGYLVRDETGLIVLVLMLALGAAAILAHARGTAIAGIAGGVLLVAVGPSVAEAMLGMRLPVMAAIAAFVTMIVLRLGSSVLRSYLSGVSSNDLSGLPNAFALRADADTSGVRDVAVARIQNFGEITAVLGDAGAAELMRKVCERLAFVAGEMRIFHTGDATFAWLVPGDAVDDLPDRFDALHAIMASPVRVGARQIDVQMSYGMSTAQPDAATALRTATMAAEQAAARGQRWHAFSTSEKAELSSKMSLIGELESAIDLGQVWVAYQPKYDVATRSIVGAEALVRWLHPEKGPIRPDLFIPLAEEHGRIAKLTRHVLDTALGDFATLSTGTHKPVIAVNLSATLLSAANLVETVCDALWRHGLLPQQLTLEVTESAAMSSDEAAITALERMRSMGIGISVDDYGTGQSTLNYLKRLPATELKIDQSFIRAIGDSRSDEILVNSTIQLGHQLGLKVVAEGVETEAVFRQLESFGCDVIQGYLIGKPMPFNEFVRGYRNPPRIAA